MTGKTIYLDNAATTKMSKAAIDAMLPYMDSVYGNPSSLHSVGQAANEALVNAENEGFAIPEHLKDADDIFTIE